MKRWSPPVIYYHSKFKTTIQTKPEHSSSSSSKNTRDDFIRHYRAILFPVRSVLRSAPSVVANGSIKQ